MEDIMSLRVNHNMSAANAHRNVVNNSNAQSKTMEKLSSGLKINRAADSPAQLQISENLRAQASGLKQAIDNSEMGVSLMQTAEEHLKRSVVRWFRHVNWLFMQATRVPMIQICSRQIKVK